MTEYVYAFDGQQGHWFTGEEIVRCRDCCYYEPDGEPSAVDASWHWCDRMMQYLNPDGFCKWAKGGTHERGIETLSVRDA